MIRNETQIKRMMLLQWSPRRKGFIKEEWIIFDTLLDFERYGFIFSAEMISCLGTSYRDLNWRIGSCFFQENFRYWSQNFGLEYYICSLYWARTVWVYSSVRIFPESDVNV